MSRFRTTVATGSRHHKVSAVDFTDVANPVGYCMLARQRITAFSFGLLALLLALPLLPPLHAATAAARADDAPWRSVTIVYNSDVKGHIDPCG
ncbi:MAG: hypothetical protein PHQ53_10895 [Candidatus Krumholzibacteria bacterium]|nr:hypothetical protein [Candidatus Krumholzibacteria bacterium]